MVAIYICEDNLIFQQEVKRTIENYLMIQAYNMHVALATADPQALLEEIHEGNERSIYFLDVDLKHESMNGFDLGKQIRQLDTRGFIIFITDHSELLAETFKFRLEAMDYIIKGDLENIQKRVCECLDSAKDRLDAEQKETRRYLPIKSNNERFYIPIEDIYFIETSPHQHKVALYAEDQQIEFFGILNKLEDELGESFIRVHRSYLVNSKKITRIDFKARMIHFEDELSCPFTRSMKNELKTLEAKEGLANSR
ncbi:DNA-binding response regulator [Enterococcus florum]|uniref:DNA-binding response regulator n=1 Tax=Enterococcus florum TaxID=2480627 RepID=A0A4P5PC68_9ENTE|nr:LytTR family DNA-binding domain-containing protein [Enterococcus florum]GCF95670.1 DNA-binding response regulator [Enterococcus florum]